LLAVTGGHQVADCRNGLVAGTAADSRARFRATPKSPGRLDIPLPRGECRIGHADQRDAPAQSISGEEDLIARSPRLTPRERQVVIGLFRGGSNKSIGLELNLSPRTVEFHRAKLMRRFGAKSLIGLIAAILQPHA